VVLQVRFKAEALWQKALLIPEVALELLMSGRKKPGAQP